MRRPDSPGASGARVSVCASDTLVRDPVFTPILQSLTDDPNAAPDADALAALRARVPQVFLECRQPTRS